MVLRTSHISIFILIPSADDDIIVHVPSMGTIDDLSTDEKLKFLLGKS